MVIRVRVEPIDRDIKLLLDETLSPEAQKKFFAEYAHEQIEEAKDSNRRILGRMPRYTVWVDGREGAPLSSVNLSSHVVAEFELLNDVLIWISDQLETHSPVKTGRYQRSHSLFADGIETEVGKEIPFAEEYVFLNHQPYARKIERGSSSQAPTGVYQAVAKLASSRFGNIARIRFSFRTAMEGAVIGGKAGNQSELRNPAIVIRLPR